MGDARAIRLSPGAKSLQYRKHHRPTLSGDDFGQACNPRIESRYDVACSHHATSPVASEKDAMRASEGQDARVSGAQDMLRQLLVGAAVSACNIGIHALVMTAVVRVARGATAKERPGQARMLAVMIATVSVLMLAHIAEVASGRWPTRWSMRRRVAPMFWISRS